MTDGQSISLVEQAGAGYDARSHRRGAVMPRTKPADERRADLLAAAEALFVSQGVPTTTTEDITRKAGVSKGLFYLYFRSKEDLLASLQERFVTAFAESVRAAADAQRDW